MHAYCRPSFNQAYTRTGASSRELEQLAQAQADEQRRRWHASAAEHPLAEGGHPLAEGGNCPNLLTDLRLRYLT
jgi:hypothetical protein